MVTSDRMSAFDVVMAEPIPHKGRVLTAMSAYWFEVLGDVVGSTCISTDLADLPDGVAGADDDLAGRIMLCHKAEMLPIECIVRGLHHRLGLEGVPGRRHDARPGPAGRPAGERRSCPSPCSRRPRRPTSGHDENISYEAAVDLVGDELAAQARDVSLELYRRGAELARERGIIIADTKFELGLVDGELVLCDEVLTPDSSRFWPEDEWKPGTTPPSFDKQPLRDYLEGLGWDKTPPPPAAARRGRSPPPSAATSRATSASPAAASPTWPGVDLSA